MNAPAHRDAPNLPDKPRLKPYECSEYSCGFVTITRKPTPGNPHHRVVTCGRYGHKRLKGSNVAYKFMRCVLCMKLGIPKPNEERCPNADKIKSHKHLPRAHNRSRCPDTCPYRGDRPALRGPARSVVKCMEYGPDLPVSHGNYMCVDGCVEDGFYVTIKTGGNE